MRALVGLASLTVLIALGGAAQAAKPKAAPDSCKTSVADFVKYLGEDAKDVFVSPVLSAVQYDMAKSALEKHKGDHKALPGDGAVFIVVDGHFIMALTKGKDSAAKICAVADVPSVLVAAIFGTTEPKAQTPKAATKKLDPNVLSL